MAGSDAKTKQATPERDWQQALFIPLTILAWLAVAFIGGWLLSHVLRTILTIVFSGIVAFALTPLVHLFSRWMPKPLAIALAYLAGFAVIFGLAALLVVSAADEINNLVKHLKQYGDDLRRLEPQIVHILSPFGVNKTKYDTAQRQLIAYLQSAGTSVASQSVSIVASVLTTLVDIVLILILSVYLTANGERIATFLRRQTPTSHRSNTVLLIGIVNRVVGGYIRGTLTMSSLIGVLVGGGLFALQVPYALLLGVLAFFMEFIPVVGVIISGAVSVGVALTQGWVKALIVLAYFVVVHIIEGDVVGPRVMGKAVGIHPATALIAFVAGTELFGVWGALLGAPLAGLLQSIGTAAWLEFRGQDPRAVLSDVKEEVKEAGDEVAADQAEERSHSPPRKRKPTTSAS
jgi:predicted PurR-regulated permease PerM